MPIMAADLSLSTYQSVLSALYGILRAWDEWAERHAPPDLRQETLTRLRSPLLEADLAYFHLPVPQQRATLDLPMSEAGFLGAMYVMEGSTLGGQYIARHVEQTLGLQPGKGDAYFIGYGEHTSERWRVFQGILRDLPEHQTAEVISGARAMFTQFRLWMVKQFEKGIRAELQTHGR